jgi:hypothetical protein
MSWRFTMKLLSLIVLVAGVVAAQLAPPVPAQTTPRPVQSIPAIAKSANGAIVTIITAAGDKPLAQGTGFLVSADGVIVTNYHVIKEGNSAIVKFPDGTVLPIDGVLAADKVRDLAVIKIHGKTFRTLTLGNSDHVQVGEEVVAIGNPLSLESTVSNGIVSGMRTSKEQGGKFLQTTAPISPGSSGGPLFNMLGEVVGVNTMYLEGGENLNFAIPINDAKRLIQIKSSKIQTLPNEPEPVNANVEQIENLMQSKKFDEARVALQTLKAKEPDSAAAHRLTGELDENTGDIDGALRELGLSLEKDPSDAVAHFYYAIALYEARHFEDALAHEMTSNELAPTAADLPLIALLYYSVRNYKQAENMARKALSSDAKNETALTVLAGVAFHGASTQQDGWSKYAQQLLIINSDNFWVHLSQG